MSHREFRRGARAQAKAGRSSRGGILRPTPSPPGLTFASGLVRLAFRAPSPSIRPEAGRVRFRSMYFARRRGPFLHGSSFSHRRPPVAIRRGSHSLAASALPTMKLVVSAKRFGAKSQSYGFRTPLPLTFCRWSATHLGHRNTGVRRPSVLVVISTLHPIEVRDDESSSPRSALSPQSRQTRTAVLFIIRSNVAGGRHLKQLTVPSCVTLRSLPLARRPHGQECDSANHKDLPSEGGGVQAAFTHIGQTRARAPLDAGSHPLVHRTP